MEVFGFLWVWLCSGCSAARAGQLAQQPSLMAAALLHTGMSPGTSQPWVIQFLLPQTVPVPPHPGQGMGSVTPALLTDQGNAAFWDVLFPDLPSQPVRSDAETSPSSVESHLLPVRRGNHLGLCFTASAARPGEVTADPLETPLHSTELSIPALH